MAAAEEETQRKAVWLRKRFGSGVLNWANESYSSEVTFWRCVFNFFHFNLFLIPFSPFVLTCVFNALL